MSWSETERLRARHVVEARLGRPPQDMLEAAVVLEAFKGLPAAEALATGRQIMASTPREPQASVAEVPYTFDARHSGVSKAGIGEGLTYLRRLAELRVQARRAPQRSRRRTTTGHPRVNDYSHTQPVQ